MTSGSATSFAVRAGTSAEALAMQRVLRELDGRIVQPKQGAKQAG